MFTKNIHCLGDSHAEAFKHVSTEYYWLMTKFYFKFVRGASATGLGNPRSKTNAINEFKKYLDDNSKNNDWLLIQIGEVDCGFVIWFREMQGKGSVGELFNESLNNYKRFVDYLINKGYNKIILVSVPLPTIGDDAPLGEVAEMRSSIRVDQKTRTVITKKYNSELYSYAKEKNILFLNYEPEITNAETGLVKTCFKNENPGDHHLNVTKIAPILRRKLRKLGFI